MKIKTHGNRDATERRLSSRVGLDRPSDLRFSDARFSSGNGLLFPQTILWISGTQAILQLLSLSCFLICKSKCCCHLLMSTVSTDVYFIWITPNSKGGRLEELPVGRGGFNFRIGVRIAGRWTKFRRTSYQVSLQRGCTGRQVHFEPIRKSFATTH